MEWQGDRPFGSAADAAGKEFGRVGKCFLHCGRRQRDTDVGPEIRYRCPEYSRTEETSAAALCTSIVRKLEVAKRTTARGSRLGNVDVTFLLLRRARSIEERMIMIVGSMGFGQL